MLLVSRAQTALPTKALICVSGGEASKEDVLFAGRLARHLGATATLLSVLPENADIPEERERATRFLEAGARTLALLDVPAAPVLRSGPLRETIQAEMMAGGHSLLVVGAPMRPFSVARIRPILAGEVSYPVLVVRSPYAAAAALSRASAKQEEMV